MASDKTFQLQIVTPRKSAFSGPVVDIQAPGTMGRFEVMHNHSPFLSSLKVGEISVRLPDGDQLLFATSGGFTEVLENTVTMLAETAETAAEIDLSRAEEARKRAEQRLSDRKPDLDVVRAELALTRAINRIRVGKRHKR